MRTLRSTSDRSQLRRTRTQLRGSRLRVTVAGTLVLLAWLPTRGGGPRAVNGLGQPMKWNTAAPIAYNPDLGPLGTLNNSEARALLASAFAEWASVGVVSFIEGSALPADVSGAGIPATNAAHFRNHWRVEGDAGSPVIFDHDGSVIDELFGAGARFDILGIGALDTPLGHCAGGGNPGARCTTDCECQGGGTCSPSAAITEASMVINGLFFDGVGLPDSPPDVVTSQDLKAVMVHEIGHFLNLDHSVLNHELAQDGNPANDIYLPTMYPVASEDEAALATLNPDDVAALRALYDTGPVTTLIGGSVATSTGLPFQGAEVVLRKSDDPLMTAYSVTSGDQFFPFNAGSTCNPCSTACDPGSAPARGAYALKFIQAGSYTACVRQIDTRFSPSNGTFVGPLFTPALLPGPEECYDLAESGLASDDPDDAATVVAGVVGGVNIQLDELPGAGSDAFEPNNTLEAAATLADLAGGHDTAPAYLGAGDLDFYAIPVTSGRRVHIDIDAAELGSSLDAVIGLYSSTDILLAVVDDAVDPDSGEYTVDPALEFVASFTGTAKVVVASYPDLDLNGTGGATTGGYWIRVRYADDFDGDGVGDDADDCPGVADPTQQDFDGDGLGDACDADDDNDGLLDSVETNTGTFVSAGDTGTNPRNPDSDGDGVSDGLEVAAGSNPDVGSSSPGLFGAQRLISTAASDAFDVFAADIDGDGDIDALSASILDDKIAWYENLDGRGTFGSEQVISNTADAAFSVFAADVDGDGDMDVLSASDVNPKIVWYENTDGAGSFGPEHVISNVFSDNYTCVRAADVDGDGDVDVLSANGSLGGKIAWYENVDGAGTFGGQQVISTAVNNAFSVFVADVDGDGDEDVLSASDNDNKIAWYENLDGAGTFGPQRIITTGAFGARSVFAADVDGDGDADVLSASDVDDKIAWYENLDGAGTFGVQRVISNSANIALSVFGADVDGDGDLDVLSASSDFTGEIVWYENTDGAGTFGPRHVISIEAISAASVYAADVDGDGDLDVLSASFGDDKVAWYENRSIHRSATFPAPSVISNTAAAEGAISVFAADVDGDGDADVLAALYTGSKIVWYENLDGAGGFGLQQVIATGLNEPISIFAVDVDGDGDEDVLSASFSSDTIAWYANRLNEPTADFGAAQVISLSAAGAHSVFAADVDGDGDVDVLSASSNDNKIAWYENLDGAGSFGPERVISMAAQNARSVFAGDVDGDGDVDVLSASSGDSKAAWYENRLNEVTADFGPQRVISTSAILPYSVFAADVDGDSHLDVLSASLSDNKIAWYRNLDGAGNFGPQQVISTAALGAFAVFAADLDGDGDPDAVSASESDNRIAWYENRLNEPAADFGPRQVISTAAAGAHSVFAADIDGDGDADVLSASYLDSKAAWYRNGGGHYAFATQAVAPAALADSGTAGLLRIDLAHRGRPGDSPIVLSTLDLSFEESPGDPLSAGEANALIANLYVYLDDGSDAFEAGADELVATVATLAGGVETIAFSSTADPRLLVAHGPPKSFFVAAQMTANASSQTPSRFRVTHLASSSSARDAASGRTLVGEFSPVVSSAVTATAPDVIPPSVTGAFPDDGAVDVSLSTTVVVSMTEPIDASTVTPVSISLSVAGIKVVGKLAVSSDGRLVTFDPTGSLAVDTTYTIEVTSGLRDLAGNGAIPFNATFDTVNTVGSATIVPVQVGNPADEDVSGAVLDGQDADEHFGFAVAAVGDVNQDGIADLVVGSPAANIGALVDAGKATLVFGGPRLQSNAVDALRLRFLGSAAQDSAGTAVARAGDINHDGIADFAVGAPESDRGGTDAGTVFVVFGNALLDELAPGAIGLDTLAATSGGTEIVGAAAGDLAGSSVAYAGDVDGDGNDDLFVGAPGASPGGRAQAGSVYLLFGPLSAGTINLSTVGCPAAPHRGIVFQGENAGDRAGESVSWWEDGTGFDDLLIGAPGAAVLDEYGATIPEAGYLYAIHGGPANLGTCGTIELNRVANGLANQIGGVVFLGAVAHGRIGRSVTGAVDVDGDGVADVIVGGNNEVWLVPGSGPKNRSGSDTLSDQTVNPTPVLVRQLGGSLAVAEFGATRFSSGLDGVLGTLAVGPAGDVNNDGIDDFVIGAAGADSGANIDAGRVYIVYGRPSPFGNQVFLSEVGGTVSGFTVHGAEAGDALGNTVGGGFDVNDDRVDDALAGAPFADAMLSIPSDAGQAFVLSPVSPEEVVLLRLARPGGVTTLEWSGPHRALVYNVYRGLLSVLRTVGYVKTSDTVQLACEISTDADADQLPDTTDGTSPSSGAAFYYLVTGENLTGEGPLGPPEAAPPRVLDAQCP